MSTKVHLFSDHGLDFEVEPNSPDEDPTIWIRSRRINVCISLSMSYADRAALRAALDHADAIADESGT